MDASQWRGSQCGIVKSAHAVFRQDANWDKFWTLAIKPYLSRPRPTPSIDFTKNMVVGVFRGEKTVPGDIIEIRSAKQEQLAGEPVVVVRYKNSSQMQPVFSPPFPVQPFHLKKIPVLPGRVVFMDTGKTQ